MAIGHNLYTFLLSFEPNKLSLRTVNSSRNQLDCGDLQSFVCMEVCSIQIKSGIIFFVPVFVAVYIPRNLIKADKLNPYLKLSAV